MAATGQANSTDSVSRIGVSTAPGRIWRGCRTRDHLGSVQTNRRSAKGGGADVERAGGCVEIESQSGTFVGYTPLPDASSWKFEVPAASPLTDARRVFARERSIPRESLAIGAPPAGSTDRWRRNSEQGCNTPRSAQWSMAPLADVHCPGHAPLICRGSRSDDMSLTPASARSSCCSRASRDLRSRPTVPASGVRSNPSNGPSRSPPGCRGRGGRPGFEQRPRIAYSKV